MGRAAWMRSVGVLAAIAAAFAPAASAQAPEGPAASCWIEAHAQCQGAFLHGANLRNADLRYANLKGADLTKANLDGANLHGADLTGANLTEAHGPRANLSSARLTGTVLSHARLHNANLNNADLSHAAGALDATHATARHANFAHANLRGVTLKHADVQFASFNGVTVTHSNLTAADLRHANFAHANFRHTQTRLAHADHTTTLWPSNFNDDLRAVSGLFAEFRADQDAYGHLGICSPGSTFEGAHAHGSCAATARLGGTHGFGSHEPERTAFTWATQDHRHELELGGSHGVVLRGHPSGHWDRFDVEAIHGLAVRPTGTRHPGTPDGPLVLRITRVEPSFPLFAPGYVIHTHGWLWREPVGDQHYGPTPVH